MIEKLLAYLGKGELYALNKGIRYERKRIANLPFVHEIRFAPGLEDDHKPGLCVTCQNIALIKAESK